MTLPPPTLLYSNERFVVPDKPAGWLSVPSRMGAADTRPCVGKILEETLKVRLWPVHRLDLEVTGILLFAKDAEAHRLANYWFENRLVGKTYEAISSGDPAEGSEQTFIWRSNLLRGKKRAYESPHGKPSETAARVQRIVNIADGPAILWHLEPHTGRPHQLRYELSRHGYPILGDRLYGSDRPCPSSPPNLNQPEKYPYIQDDNHSIALRCVSLDFSRCAEASSLGLPEVLMAPSLPRCYGLEEIS